MIPDYEKNGPALIARDPETNGMIWSWTCDDGEITRIGRDAIGGGCAVLVDASKDMSARNILYFRADGRLAWVAEDAPAYGGYVDVDVQAEGIGANSWSGYKVLLSRDSGRILWQDFTK